MFIHTYFLYWERYSTITGYYVQCKYSKFLGGLLYCGDFKYLTLLLSNLSFHLVTNDSKIPSYIET